MFFPFGSTVDRAPVRLLRPANNEASHTHMSTMLFICLCVRVCLRGSVLVCVLTCMLACVLRLPVWWVVGVAHFTI